MSIFGEADSVKFAPEKQSNLTNEAFDICNYLLWQDGGKMPKIPWLSQDGQEASFYKVSDMVIERIIQNPRLSFDQLARSGVYFWSLVLIAANNRRFRIAVAAAKRTKPKLYEAGAFLQWYGTEVHPSLAVAANAALWSKMRDQGSFKSDHWTTNEINRT